MVKGIAVSSQKYAPKGFVYRNNPEKEKITISLAELPAGHRILSLPSSALTSL
jgi:hypothetical protein